VTGIGCRIVEYEQRGKERAQYREATLTQLSRDLTGRYGRGFCRQPARFRLSYAAIDADRRPLSTPLVRLCALASGEK
jgi:hypothetical protein